MLQDVIARTQALGEDIGCRGLLVHAETTGARDFYRHLVPVLEASPTDGLHLFQRSSPQLPTSRVRSE